MKSIYKIEMQNFIQAVKENNLTKIKFLLEKGINIHTNNNLALRIASEFGYYEVVELLLKNGADIHAENDSALYWASKRNHLDIVILLIKKGANIYADDNLALRTALENKNLEIVELLKNNMRLNLGVFLK